MLRLGDLAELFHAVFRSATRFVGSCGNFFRRGCELLDGVPHFLDHGPEFLEGLGNGVLEHGNLFSGIFLKLRLRKIAFAHLVGYAGDVHNGPGEPLPENESQRACHEEGGHGTDNDAPDRRPDRCGDHGSGCCVTDDLTPGRFIKGDELIPDVVESLIGGTGVAQGSLERIDPACRLVIEASRRDVQCRMAEDLAALGKDEGETSIGDIEVIQVVQKHRRIEFNTNDADDNVFCPVRRFADHGHDIGNDVLRSVFGFSDAWFEPARRSRFEGFEEPRRFGVIGGETSLTYQVVLIDVGFPGLFGASADHRTSGHFLLHVRCIEVKIKPFHIGLVLHDRKQVVDHAATVIVLHVGHVDPLGGIDPVIHYPCRELGQGRCITQDFFQVVGHDTGLKVHLVLYVRSFRIVDGVTCHAEQDDGDEKSRDHDGCRGLLPEFFHQSSPLCQRQSFMTAAFHDERTADSGYLLGPCCFRMDIITSSFGTPRTFC